MAWSGDCTNVNMRVFVMYIHANIHVCVYIHIFTHNYLHRHIHAYISYTYMHSHMHIFLITMLFPDIRLDKGMHTHKTRQGHAYT